MRTRYLDNEENESRDKWGKKAEMKVCHEQELLVTLQPQPQAGSLRFQSWGFRRASLAFPGRAITQWLREQGCAGKPHGVVLTENNNVMSESALGDASSVCHYQAAPALVLNLRRLCRILEGRICLTSSSTIGIRWKPIWCIGGTLTPQRSGCTQLLPQGD